jgi:hypothetical protein
MVHTLSVDLGETIRSLPEDSEFQAKLKEILHDEPEEPRTVPPKIAAELKTATIPQVKQLAEETGLPVELLRKHRRLERNRDAAKKSRAQQCKRYNNLKHLVATLEATNKKLQADNARLRALQCTCAKAAPS